MECMEQPCSLAATSQINPITNSYRSSQPIALRQVYSYLANATGNGLSPRDGIRRDTVATPVMAETRPAMATGFFVSTPVHQGCAMPPIPFSVHHPYNNMPTYHGAAS